MAAHLSRLAGELVIASRGSSRHPAVISLDPISATHYRRTPDGSGLSYRVQWLDALTDGWVRAEEIDAYEPVKQPTAEEQKTVLKRASSLLRLPRRKRLQLITKWATQEASKTVVSKRKRPSNGAANTSKKKKKEKQIPLPPTPPLSSSDTGTTADSSLEESVAHVAGRCCVCSLPSTQLLACEGGCCELFHPSCLGLPCSPSGRFVCDECAVMATVCFVCQQADDRMLIACSVLHCDKSYHLDCLQQYYSRTCDVEKKPLFCPRHKCARCLNQGRGSQKLIYCTQCPIALHDNANCFIAGCEVAPNGGNKYMTCHRHLEKAAFKGMSHINLNTCLDCGQGGQLLCCDVCSAAYHSECLAEGSCAVDEGEGSGTREWLCPDCTSCQLPVFGGVVWCKLGVYRWWPTWIIPVKKVPERFLKTKKYKGTFLVEFLGSGDHAWMHHGRCLPFTTENSAHLSYNHRATIDQHFREGYQIALQLYMEAEEKIEKQRLHQKCSKKYISLKQNKYLVPFSRHKEAEPCQCTAEHPCTLSSVCVNRATMVECSPTSCPVKELCHNQRMQQQQYANVEIFHTRNKGWALRAVQDIQRGDFVIEYIGEVVDNNTCMSRIAEAEQSGLTSFYMLTLTGGLVIDARFKANKARFINHSCEPNLVTQPWTVNGRPCIGLFAISDIPSGTELTFDYQLDCVGDDKLKCHCGTSSCVGYLGAKRSKAETKSSKKKQKMMKRPKTKQRSTRRRHIPNKYTSSQHEETCFWCGDGGELLMCDVPACSKAYHLECLEITMPRGQWQCPWHFCDECGKKSCRSCPECPTSFCSHHGTGEMMEVKGVSYCVDHIPN